MRKPILLVAVGVAMVASVAMGCEGVETVPKPGDVDPGSGDQLTVALPLQACVEGGAEVACGVFAGFRYTVMNLETGEQKTCTADAYDFTIGAPYAGAGSTGSYHFGDCYLDEFDPGEVVLLSLELTGEDGEVLDCCTVELPGGSFYVEPGKTTELSFMAQCTMPHGGQLDIYVPVNLQPDIIHHVFTKFFHTCELMEMAVEVTDPDGDATEVTWAVASAPAGAEFELGQYGTEATFITETAGDYEIEVTVCDEHDFCWSESWPLHVLPGDDGCLCPMPEPICY